MNKGYRKPLLISALCFFALSIAINKWTLGLMFSADGKVETRSTIISIAIFEAILFFQGLMLLAYRSTALPPKLKRLAGGLNICMALLLIIELVSFILIRTSDVVKQVEYILPERTLGGIGIPDKLLGHKPKTNITANLIKTRNGRVVFDIIYTSDENYHRWKTPVDNMAGRDSFIAFFGGSFVLGAGLNDNETVAYYTGKFAGRHMPYNYGFGGYGTQQMLINLQREGIREEIKEQKGIGIYYFLDCHINRAIGSMRTFNIWTDKYPYFYLDEEDNLIYGGNFRDGRPLKTFIFDFLSASQFIRYLKIDNIPPVPTRSHIHLTIRIIEEAYKLFRKKFPGSEFYCLLYPVYSTPSRLTPELDRLGIKYIDYSNLFDSTDEKYHIVGDGAIKGTGHPSALANKIIAKKLCEDLEILTTRTNH